MRSFFAGFFGILALCIFLLALLLFVLSEMIEDHDLRLEDIRPGVKRTVW